MSSPSESVEPTTTEPTPQQKRKPDPTKYIKQVIREGRLHHRHSETRLRHCGYVLADRMASELSYQDIDAIVKEVFEDPDFHPILDTSLPNTAELIRKVEALFSEHLVLENPGYGLLAATWTVATYVYDGFYYFGYLHLTSPVLRCGKTLFLDMLQNTCAKATPIMTSPTSAVTFRYANLKRTMIFDEVENLQQIDGESFGTIIQVLNSGFATNGTLTRCLKSGDDKDWTPTEFSSYCPKVIAGISDLPATLQDRVFRIVMKRKGPDRHVKPWNPRREKEHLEKLCDDLNAWAAANRLNIQELYDERDGTLPAELRHLDDRFKDISEPLITIANMADRELPPGAKPISPELYKLLQTLGGTRHDDTNDLDIGIMLTLLRDELGKESEVFIGSRALAEKARDADLPFLSTKTLAPFLKKLGLTPDRNTDRTKRGYRVTDKWLSECERLYAPPIPGKEASEVSRHG